MVQIPLRSPILSLCITITTVICELAFLTAALSFLRFRACRRLQQNKKVTIRAQHKLVLALTLFAMLAFVVLETVTSIFSDPETKQIVELQPCVRNVFGSTSDENPNESEAIHFGCTTIFRRTVTHFEGNTSLTTGKVTCATQPMYSYEIGTTESFPTNGSVFRCRLNLCAFVIVTGGTIFISDMQAKPSEGSDIKWLPTKANPEDIKLIDLGVIADTVAETFANKIREEGEVRRRALVGSFEDICPFTRDDGPATSIPLGVLIGAGIVWISSLLFFFASLFVRKRIFFDITHPMHWARKARHDVSRATGNEPEIEMVKVDGEYRVTVTGYMRNLDD